MPGKKQLAIFVKRVFLIDIISPTKPELSLFVVVVVVSFCCRLFLRLPIGELMECIRFKLCQLEHSYFARISLCFYLKQKPEETLYAELRDLDQRQRPNKPSYPEALPPVKRPAPSEP